MASLMKYFGIYVTIFAIPVSGLSFTFTRDSILIGDTGTQTLSCRVDDADVLGIYSIKMFRETVPGSNVQEPLAALNRLYNPVEPKLLVNQDGFTVGGTWDTGNVQENFLEVNMDIAKLGCKDARQYRCDLSYAQLGGGSTKTVTANATFSVYVKPVINSLDGKKNDFNLQFPNLGLSLDEKAEFEIGDELKLTCSAQIGSKPDTKIQWRMTSEISQDDEFIQYNPPEGTYTEGTALTDNKCGYDRTASITYNTSASDANRKNNLIFECYVTVSGAPYTATYTDQKHFYVKVRSEDKVTKRDLVAGAVGGVIVAVVILGVFVIVVIVRRKFKTTETQRTRLQTDISYVANSQRQLRAQTDIGLDGQASIPNTYEQLQNTVELENKNVYDALEGGRNTDTHVIADRGRKRKSGNTIHSKHKRKTSPLRTRSGDNSDTSSVEENVIPCPTVMIFLAGVLTKQAKTFKAGSEGSNGSKAQYERLQQSAGVPSAYTALTTETLNKGGDETYTNLQVENSADTGK